MRLLSKWKNHPKSLCNRFISSELQAVRTFCWIYFFNIKYIILIELFTGKSKPKIFKHRASSMSVMVKDCVHNRSHFSSRCITYSIFRNIFGAFWIRCKKIASGKRTWSVASSRYRKQTFVWLNVHITLYVCNFILTNASWLSRILTPLRDNYPLHVSNAVHTFNV